jgi:hypothetical protein
MAANESAPERASTASATAGESAAKPRGRPRRSTFAPLALDLADVMAELSTREGIERFRAELYLRARRGGTALELEFCRLEKQLLAEAEKSLTSREEIASTLELKEQLTLVERQLAGKNGSALRADMAPVPPLRGKA